MERRQINNIEALTQILERNRVPSICARGRTPQLVVGTTGYTPNDIGASVFLDGKLVGCLAETPWGKVGFYRGNREDIVRNTLDKKFPQDYEIEFN